MVIKYLEKFEEFLFFIVNGEVGIGKSYLINVLRNYF